MESDDEVDVTGSRPVEQFLIKWKGQSYLRCKWITEKDFLTKMGYQCQQKLKRYKIKRDKLAAGLC